MLCCEASQDGCSLATPVTTEEYPVVASDRHTTNNNIPPNQMPGLLFGVMNVLSKAART
jgi:hypothetical protein